MSQAGGHINNRHGGEGAAGGGIRTRDTHGPPGFSPSIKGMSYSEARDGEQSQTADLAPGSVDGTIIGDATITGYTHIIPDTLSLDLFSQSIRPPHVVAALPSLPDDEYPPGDYAFLTTTSELYLNIADVWTLEDGSTITNGTLIAGLVRAGAIAADQISAGAITTEKFHVGAQAPGVANNPADPPSSEVLIDSDGITILNGKLTLMDLGGQSVLNAAGFGGSWIDYLLSNVYNSNFGAGESTITGTTLDPDATTTAQYEAAISRDLPYWAIGAFHTGLAVTREFDVLVPGGWHLKIDNPTGSNKIFMLYQDVPIVGGETYMGLWSVASTWLATGTELKVGLSSRGYDHESVAAETTSSTVGVATYALPVAHSDAAELDARYMRLKLTATVPAGETLRIARAELFVMDERRGTLRIYDPDNEAYGLHLHKTGITFETVDGAAVPILFQGIGDTGPRFKITYDGRLEWGSAVGLVTDVKLERMGAGQLKLSGGNEPTLMISSGSSGDEGGQLILGGAGGATDWNIDAYQDRLRIHEGGTAHVQVHDDGRVDFKAVSNAVRKTNTLAIANMTWTKITAFTNTDLSPFGMSWNPYGGSEIRADYAGVYLINYFVRFAASAAGSRRFAGVMFAAGASPTFGTPQINESINELTAGSNNTVYLNGSVIKRLNANDAVAVGAWQDSGGNLNVEYASLQVVRIGT